MRVTSRAKKAASTATIVAATTGLSSCNDNGAVDPLPPPLECDAVGSGQKLAAAATRDGDSVTVVVENFFQFPWVVDSVGGATNGTIHEASLPTGGHEQLIVLLEVDDLSQPATFTVHAKLRDFTGTSTCPVRREFTVTLTDSTVTVAMQHVDGIPLPARNRAEVLVLERDGNTVLLGARTSFAGPKRYIWTVTEGKVEATEPDQVRWTLPSKPGIYQAEVVVDYGTEGLAFDALSLEVADS